MELYFDGGIKPYLLNNPFFSCFFTNLDFLLTHTTHFDDNIVLPVLAFNIFNQPFLDLSCTLNNKSTSFITS